MAEKMNGIPRYSRKRLKENLPDLRMLCKSIKSVKLIPNALRDMGIRFLVVEHLPKTKIDGATFWLSKTRPVVALSLRYGRIDYFLFTLFHELMHVLHEDVLSVDNDILQNTSDSDIPDCESRANKKATELLVPKATLDGFIRSHSGRIGKQDIILLSKSIDMHPGVVLGQLQYREAVGWSACRELLEPIREEVIKVSHTDGWGVIQKK